MRRRTLAATVLALTLARPAFTDDDPRVFSVTLDKTGAMTHRGATIDAQQLDAALSAAVKEQPDTGYSTKDLSIRVSCDAETRFAAFRRLIEAAARAGAWDFRITIGPEYVVFGLPKDRGLRGLAAQPPRILRAHLCSTGDAADHAKDWAAHAGRVAAQDSAGKAWIWLEGEDGKPVEVAADAQAIARVGRAMLQPGDSPDDRPVLEIAVDPNVSMKHVFALIAELNAGTRYRTADEEKARNSEEGLMTSYPAPFAFAEPGEAPKK